MSIKYLIIISLAICFQLLAVSLAKAQEVEKWQPLLLYSNGTNVFDGVEGFYKLTDCNNIESVSIKLVNHNHYAVKAAWKNVVITKDKQMLPSANVQDSLTLKPNSETIGDCGGKNAQLIFKLSDFGTDKMNFRSFITTGFDYVIIK